MSGNADPLQDVYAKLDWATIRHDEMQCLFEEFAKPGGGEERPYGIEFRELAKPGGLVVARFIMECPMPEEMSLLAADLIHNARVALDHVLARLKDCFGGDAGRGSFPTWQSEEDWQANVVDGGRNIALHGLDERAVEFVHSVQPLHADTPAEDPLVILNQLDNADKHRLLHQSFVYTRAERGLDLIDVNDPARVRAQTNLWVAGQPLEDGTRLAQFMIRGKPRGVIEARSDAPIGFASGDLGAPVTGYTTMIERVRTVADGAAELIAA